MVWFYQYGEEKEKKKVDYAFHRTNVTVTECIIIIGSFHNADK